MEITISLSLFIDNLFHITPDNRVLVKSHRKTNTIKLLDARLSSILYYVHSLVLFYFYFLPCTFIIRV